MRKVEKVKLVCDWCHKEYLVYPSVITKQKKMGIKSHFCNKHCKYEWNKTQEGYWKGKKIPLSTRKKMSENHADVSGSNNPRWVGGRRKDKDGYIIVYSPQHPHRDSDNYVREHRLVLEKKLKRFLDPIEVVHHENEVKDDNCLENLRLFENNAAHRRFHEELKRNSTKS